MGSTGYYFEPALIAADNSMRIAREEIFGPVACIIKFRTEEGEWRVVVILDRLPLTCA